VLLGGVGLVLWFAHQMAPLDVALWSLVLIVTFWSLGAVLQSRLSVLGASTIQAALLATATATLGLQEWHYLFKPLTMVLAVWLVLGRGGVTSALSASGRWLLAAALTASLAGDVFLMLPTNAFIPGLASFLVAHLCYIALFRQGVGWFPSRTALVVTLIFGGAMLLVLWPNLGDPVLRGAVTVYVLVICLMAAQAIGRASRLRDPGAILVALGACVFMASDTLIAINRFVTPVSLSSLWILASYYLAQTLIMFNMPAANSQTGVPAQNAVATG